MAVEFAMCSSEFHFEKQLASLYFFVCGLQLFILRLCGQNNLTVISRQLSNQGKSATFLTRINSRIYSEPRMYFDFCNLSKIFELQGSTQLKFICQFNDLSGTFKRRKDCNYDPQSSLRFFFATKLTFCKLNTYLCKDTY